MLTVTDRAREHLKSAVLPRIGTSGLSVRLTATGPGELGLVPDVPKDDDHVVEHDGATVLLVDEQLSEELTGSTIDCVDSAQGSRLTLRRPDSS